jgi:hypothetical protein
MGPSNATRAPVFESHWCGELQAVASSDTRSLDLFLPGRSAPTTRTLLSDYPESRFTHQAMIASGARPTWTCSLRSTKTAIPIHRSGVALWCIRFTKRIDHKYLCLFGLQMWLLPKVQKIVQLWQTDKNPLNATLVREHEAKDLEE